MSEHLARNGHRHRFAWYDTVRRVLSRQTIETAEDVYAIVPQVFCCQLTKEEESVVPLYFAENPRERYRNIFYITNAKDETGLQSLRNLRGDAFVDCFVIAKDGTCKDEGEWREFPIRPSYFPEDISGMGGAL